LRSRDDHHYYHQAASEKVHRYALSAREVTAQFGLDVDEGLVAGEAERRLEEYGPNERPIEPPPDARPCHLRRQPAGLVEGRRTGVTSAAIALATTTWITRTSHRAFQRTPGPYRVSAGIDGNMTGSSTGGRQYLRQAARCGEQDRQW